MKNTLLLIALVSFAFVSCTKDVEDTAGISDVSLSSMATSPDGFSVSRASHGDGNANWTIKMNDVAANAYAKGLSYPVNSMLVKEKHDESGNVSGYDVMLRTGSAHSGSFNGWMLSSLNAEGEVIFSNGERAANCQSCHSQENVKSVL